MGQESENNNQDKRKGRVDGRLVKRGNKNKPLIIYQKDTFSSTFSSGQLCSAKLWCHVEKLFT